MKSLDKNYAARRQAEDFCTISCHLLLLGNRGVSRMEFLREASRHLRDVSCCDALELHMQDNELSYCFEAIFSPAESFRFVIIREGNKIAGCPNGGDYGSIAIIPFAIDEKNSGILHLKCKSKDCFQKEDVSFFEDLCRILGIAVANRRTQVALRERVKELTCMYGISKLAERPGISLGEILRGVAKLLPPAWQFPDIACARITLDSQPYTTPGFREGRQRQSADIVVNEKKRGEVDVFYVEDKPEFDEGPFLKEERTLIETIAKQVSLIVEQHQSDEDKLYLKDQLRHADRLATLGQLSAGVAHELNEPLGNILGFAQLAMKSDGITRQAQDDIEKIVKAALHAREVVKKLMLFARQTPPKKVPINLNRLVEDGLYFLESRCAKEGIEVVRALSPDLPDITADSAQMHQVLVNLVVNAIQAMPEGGKLTVNTFAKDNYVSLIVEDTGIGMTRDVMNKIFIPFFSTKEIGQGTGLGLSVVHGIVNAHGGTIKVCSKPGQGSRFEIQLPVSRPTVDVKEIK